MGADELGTCGVSQVQRRSCVASSCCARFFSDVLAASLGPYKNVFNKLLHFPMYRKLRVLRFCTRRQYDSNQSVYQLYRAIA